MVAVAESSRSSAPRPYLALGRRIAALRERAGLSELEMARRAFISEGYPGALERGRVRPDPEVLRRLALAIDGDYEDLAILAGYIESMPKISTTLTST